MRLQINFKTNSERLDNLDRKKNGAMVTYKTDIVALV